MATAAMVTGGRPKIVRSATGRADDDGLEDMGVDVKGYQRQQGGEQISALGDAENSNNNTANGKKKHRQ